MLYDAKQRLVSSAIPGLTNTYSYDGADNLVSAQNRYGTLALPANAVNQLVSRAGQAWTYDANGNVLDDGRNTYTWDAENRLTRISNKTTGQVSEFRYDGLSHRVAILERASAGAPATETRYLWCGDRICQARDASGNVTARFFPQGEANMVAGSPVLSYYAKDNLGSVVQMVDTTGAAVGEQRYTDYGGLESSTGKKPTFGYAGMFQHSPSALSLTQYRAYDASTGRWMSRDPIEEAGGLNLYGYVSGSPINYKDPQGKELVAAAIGGVGGAFYAGIGTYLGSNGSAVFSDYIVPVVGGAVGGVAAGVTLNPAMGAAVNAEVQGALAAGADLVGQLWSGYGNKCFKFNYGSAIGAALGGATSGLAGQALTPFAQGLLGVAGVTALSSGPGVLISGIGAQLGQ